MGCYLYTTFRYLFFPVGMTGLYVAKRKITLSLLMAETSILDFYDIELQQYF